MNLIFKHGALNRDQLYWAESAMRRYPFPILLTEWPNTETSAQFMLYRDEDDDLPRPGTSRQTQMWSTFKVDAGWLFCFTEPDYHTVLRLEPEIVIDANPFQTVIQDTRPKWVHEIEAEMLSRLTFWERLSYAVAPPPTALLRSTWESQPQPPAGKVMAMDEQGCFREAVLTPDRKITYLKTATDTVIDTSLKPGRLVYDSAEPARGLHLVEVKPTASDYALGWSTARAGENRVWVEQNCPEALEGYDRYWAHVERGLDKAPGPGPGDLRT